jgi:hypothetical protein
VHPRGAVAHPAGALAPAPAVTPDPAAAVLAPARTRAHALRHPPPLIFCLPAPPPPSPSTSTPLPHRPHCACRQLVWLPPASGGCATSFVATARDPVTGSAVSQTVDSGLSATFNDLKSGRTYDFTVAAGGPAGAGAPAAARAAMPPAQLDVRPDAPTNLKVVALDDSSAQVSWGLPPGNPKVDTYEITVVPVNATGWARRAKGGGRRRYMRRWRRKRRGAPRALLTSLVSAPELDPKRPPPTHPPPSGSFPLKDAKNLTATAAGSARSATIKGLSPSSFYVFSATSKSKLGASDAPAIAFFGTPAKGATAPKAPGDVAATPAGEGAVALRWRAPSGSEPDYYQVRCAELDPAYWSCNLCSAPVLVQAELHCAGLRVHARAAARCLPPVAGLFARPLAACCGVRPTVCLTPRRQLTLFVTCSLTEVDESGNPKSATSTIANKNSTALLRDLTPGATYQVGPAFALAVWAACIDGATRRKECCKQPSKLHLGRAQNEAMQCYWPASHSCRLGPRVRPILFAPETGLHACPQIPPNRSRSSPTAPPTTTAAPPRPSPSPYPRSTRRRRRPRASRPALCRLLFMAERSRWVTALLGMRCRPAA